ncbi:MAG TPA: DUF4350 domain-containing protein [Gammaproteobacteria bacterium]|nr:DUF4350 domain-containing protein [Gammaproteobacteria bacterium]
MSKRLFKLALLLFPVGLLLVYLAQHVEIREVATPVPLKGEAARNSLYAAGLFLREMGFHTESHLIHQLDDALPSTSAAIIIDDNHDAISETTQAALLQWVGRGGKLLLRPDLSDLDPQTGFFRDKLLSRLGITVRYQRNVDREGNSEMRINRRDGDQYLEVDFDDHLTLEGDRPDDMLMLDNNGIHLIQRALSQGTVSILSDLEFIDNTRIGSFSHASLLWQLLNWDGVPPSQIWLIHSEEPPSLPELLWRNARPVLLIVGLWLALFLVTAGHRFGPLKAPREQPRRSLKDHIEASGRWYWRHGQQNRLLESSRQMVQRKMNQLHPQWTNLSDEQRFHRLAELVHWPVSRIEYLLQSEAPKEREAFTRLISELETLRTSL